MKEVWKDIKGYENTYQVSNLGRIRSLKTFKYSRKENKTIEVNRIKILSLLIDKKGYVQVYLGKTSKRKHKKVHRLVAETFIQNPYNLPQVNHIDGNKENNSIKNLEWVNNSQNQKHAFKLGLQKRKKGKENKFSKHILQYDLNGNFLKKWIGIADTERKLGICKISACCRGKRKTAGGYVWKFE